MIQFEEKMLQFHLNFCATAGMGVIMGVSRVGQEGANAPSWNLKMMTSYVVLLYNALNFSLAPSALALIAPKFSLNFHKTSKNRVIFHFLPSARKKLTIFHFCLQKMSVILSYEPKICKKCRFSSLVSG